MPANLCTVDNEDTDEGKVKKQMFSGLGFPRLAKQSVAVIRLTIHAHSPSTE